MQIDSWKGKNYIQEDYSSYKKGLAFQRERFKAGKDGTGRNNFDLMCDAIENLKSDLKIKVVKNGRKDILKRIQRIIDWYRTKELRYARNTEEGRMVIYPIDIEQKINKNLTIAYELLIAEMEELELL